MHSLFCCVFDKARLVCLQIEIFVYCFFYFFLPIRLNLRGGHQTGFGKQVQRGNGGKVRGRGAQRYSSSKEVNSLEKVYT